MKLQGRNLSTGVRGDDVRLLHAELRQLGFSIPDAELTIEMFGDATAAVVKLFQSSHQLRPNGIVDAITAAAINRDVDGLALVRGHVRQGDDAPFTAGKVQAFDKDLRSEELLGEVGLSEQGRYEIRYSADKFRRAEKRRADLIVRVTDREERVLFSSEVIFNAATEQTVDIVLDLQSAGSEFERYLTDIQPLLERVTLAELTEADIDFVAGDTGIPLMHVAWLVVAHQHAATTGVDAAIFYGLFRQDAPTSLPALLMLSPTTLRAALDSAIKRQVIPKRSPAEIDQSIQALLKQRREQLLRPNGETAAIAGLLGTGGLNGDEQSQFMDAYLSFDGDSEAFWKSLESTPLSLNSPAAE